MSGEGLNNVAPNHQNDQRNQGNNFNQPLMTNCVEPQQNFPNQGQPNYNQPNYNQPPQQNYNQGYPQNNYPNYPPQGYQSGYQPPSNNNNIVVVQQQAAQPTPTVIVVNHDSDSYPTLDKVMAVIVLIVNIFAPGIGTIIMGCVGNNAGGWICIGICQLFLAVFLIGWIWAIITGLMCLKHSRN